MYLGFRPYVERLINALCKHCQIEPGTEGLLEEGNDFADFRFRVIDLLREIIFIAGPTNVFKHMLEHLSGASKTPTSWEVTEAALFIMQATARNLDPSVDESVAQVLDSLLNVPETAHIAIRHISIKLVGELSVWIAKHPEFLERILNWILVGLQAPLLSSAAAHTLVTNEIYVTITYVKLVHSASSEICHLYLFALAFYKHGDENVQ